LSYAYSAGSTKISVVNFTFQWPFLQKILSIVFGRDFYGEEEILAFTVDKQYFKALYALYNNT
jgi:hypothetical protein